MYAAIFDGTGLNWLFPWVNGNDRTFAALNLQQTLIKATPLMLTGLAVAFAFRCGMFNIGGQGQYTVGTIIGVWVGSSWAGIPGPAHIVLAIVLASLAGAFFAGVAGLLKATVGAHEVISTIMLNWTDVVDGAKLPVVWGDTVLQGSRSGSSSRSRRSSSTGSW